MNKLNRGVVLSKMLILSLSIIVFYVSASEAIVYIGFKSYSIGSYILFTILLGYLVTKKEYLLINSKEVILLLLILLCCILLSNTMVIYFTLPLIYILIKRLYLCSDLVEKEVENNLSAIIYSSILIIILIYYLIGFSIFDLRSSLLFDPNFFAGSFIFVFIALIYASPKKRNISLFLLIIVSIVSLSRALFIALIIIFFVRELVWPIWRSYYRLISPIILLLTVLYPFIYMVKDDTNVNSYNTEITRLLDFNDRSSFGRSAEIRLAAEQVMLKNHYIINNDFNLGEIRKPHNWFWSLAVNYGLILPIIFTLCFLYFVISLTPKISLLICSLLVFCGFLDHISLWPALYLFCIITAIKNSDNMKDNANIITSKGIY